MPTRTLVILALAGSLFSSFAIAADPAPAAPAVAPAPAVEPANPMGGPNVKPATTTPEKPTLVKRDFAGKLQPLDARPEYVALDLLELSPTEKSAIDTLRTERATRISQVLQKHYTLFLDIQGDNQSGDRAKAMGKIRELRQAEPDLFDPPLSERLTAALSTENKDIFNDVLAEYAKAEAADRTPPKTPGAGTGEDSMRDMDPAAPAPDARPRRRAAPQGATPPAFDARRRETMLTMREIGGSLKATVQERNDRSATFMKAISASPELEEKIREILRASGANNPGAEPSAEARAETTRKIFALLTPEQRAQWLAASREK
jgi:hypothetical protein